MNFDPLYLLLFLPIIVALIYLRLRYKFWRGKKLTEFARSKGFSILNIENIKINIDDPLRDTELKRQQQLYDFIGPASSEAWLTNSGYFASVHVESVIKKNKVNYRLIILEVAAIIDHNVERPSVRPQDRRDDWDGNIVIFQIPGKNFESKVVINGNWRLFYAEDRIIAFRYDWLKLKALWSVSKLDIILNQVTSLVESDLT
ncbi:MAG: hypothetical protein ABJK37_02815 [Paraglaciecola sp.]|uniref:hypothetical protein n=1 Tax=Paraglaciecola sp. TaxID=1920173 RepID=UPI003296EC4B